MSSEQREPELPGHLVPTPKELKARKVFSLKTTALSRLYRKPEFGSAEKMVADAIAQDDPLSVLETLISFLDTPPFLEKNALSFASLMKTTNDLAPVRFKLDLLRASSYALSTNDLDPFLAKDTMRRSAIDCNRAEAILLATMFALRLNPEDIFLDNHDRSFIMTNIDRITNLHPILKKHPGTTFLVSELTRLVFSENPTFSDLGQEIPKRFLDFLKTDQAQPLAQLIVECMEKYSEKSSCYVDPRTFINPWLIEFFKEDSQPEAEKLPKIFSSDELAKEYREACLMRLEIDFTGTNRIPTKDMFILIPYLMTILSDNTRMVDVGCGALPLLAFQMGYGLPLSIKSIHTFDQLPADEALAAAGLIFADVIKQQKGPPYVATELRERLQGNEKVCTFLKRLRMANFSLDDYDRPVTSLNPIDALILYLQYRHELQISGVDCQHFSGKPFHEFTDYPTKSANFVMTSRSAIMHAPDNAQLLQTIYRMLNLGDSNNSVFYFHHGLAQRFGGLTDLVVYTTGSSARTGILLENSAATNWQPFFNPTLEGQLRRDQFEIPPRFGKEWYQPRPR